MAAKKSDYSPIRTGVDPRKDGSGDGGGKMWLKLDAGEYQDVTCLVEADDIIATEQCAIWQDDGNSPVWVYTGPNDPSHDLKIERRYRAYLPVLDSEGEPRVFSMGKMVHKQLLEIADATGSIEGLELRLKRTGNGLATRYSVVQKGKRYDVSKVEEVDVISLLGPLTPEGVQELIATKMGKGSYEEVLEAYLGKASKKAKMAAAEAAEPKAKAAKKKTPLPVVEEPAEEEDEDLELA